MSDQIFISYRRYGADAQARAIKERLEKEGYTVFFDIDSLPSGKYLPIIEVAIQNCTDFLLLLPKESLARCWNSEDVVRKEIECALRSDKNIIPIMLDGFEFPKDLPESIKSIPDFTGVKLEKMDQFNGAMLKLYEMLHSKRNGKGFQTGDISSQRGNTLSYQIQDAGIPKELTHSVPKEQILFREDIIEEILEKIDGEKRNIVLSGLGGIGKTAIARCLYHKLKEKYDYLGWIPYQNSLENSILQAFRCFESEDSNQRLTYIRRFLQDRTGSILLIIDNVDYINVRDSFLEELTGTDITLILTSRLEYIPYFEKITVNALLPDQCIDLFYHYYGLDQERKKRDIVADLVKQFQYHTISIEILAKSARYSSGGLERFCNVLVNQNKAKGSRIRISSLQEKVQTNYSGRKDTLVGLLRTVFDIVGLSEAQQYVLKNLAMMPSMNIPSEVVQWIRCDVNDLIDLNQRGWVELNEDGYYMHPVVKSVILVEPLRQEIANAFVETLAEGTYSYCQSYYEYYGFRSIGKNNNELFYDLPSLIARKITIAEDVLENADKKSITYAKACTNLGLLCHDQARFETAGKYYKLAMDSLKSVEAPGEDIATVRTMQAILEKYMGRYQVAEEYFLEALNTLNSVTKNLPIQAVANNLLGDMYRIQSRYNEASIHLHKAREIRIELFGENSWETAISYNDCAILDEYVGDYDSAETGYKKMEEIAENLDCKQTPSIGALYHNLGRLYFKWGKYTLSHHYYDLALSSRLNLRGEKHSDTASTYRSIGELYLHEQEYEKAKFNLEKAQEIAEVVWTPDHMSIGNIEILLAELYWKEGEYTDARKRAEKAYSIYYNKVGENHPFTQHAKEVMENMRKCCQPT